MESLTAFRLFGRFVRGHGRYFLVAVITSAVSILFNFLSPQIVRFTVDSVIGVEEMNLPGFLLALTDRLGGREGLRESLIYCALGVIICTGISALFNYWSRMSLARGTEGFIKSLRDTLFAHVQRLPFKWHVENQTGDIIQRCTSDVEVIHGFISEQLIEAIRTVVLIATALALMFSMNVPLAIAAAAFIPLVVLYSTLFYGRLARQFLKADECEGELMVRVQENLTGVRVVKAFGRERFEREKFNEKNDKFAKAWIDMGNTLGIYFGIGDVAMGLQVMLIVVLGAYLAATGSMTLGVFIAFVSYSQTLGWPVRALGRTLSEMSKTGVSARRLLEILDAEPEAEQPEAKEPDLAADITFDHVSFSYRDAAVLEDLSFTIPQGTVFGVLGGTGSGKSTITYLLSRLYDLEEGGGSIRIGGTDIREIDRKYLRKQVGLVLQEPFLFSKTIGENIAIAREGADLSSIRRAARVADVDESIMSFLRGYDTVVGERGVTLSGGQKQRVAIARTLMLDAPILIFDDSLSAVDMETDAKIQAALRENTGGATVILISHRVSTLMHADQILVLDGGRQAELGTHAELLAKGGIYSRVYDMQSMAGEGGA